MWLSPLTHPSSGFDRSHAIDATASIAEGAIASREKEAQAPSKFADETTLATRPPRRGRQGAAYHAYHYHRSNQSEGKRPSAALGSAGSNGGRVLRPVR